ncbi:MAG: ABC transporter ATP-binding protein [Actinomycetota bacterium]
MSPLLSVEGLAVDYGGVQALRGIDLEVPEGSMVAVLGPNGAGKSTTLRALAGLVRSTGRVMFDGQRVDRLAPHARARRGLVLVPEGRLILPDLTVLENLKLGSRLSTDREALDRALSFFPALESLLGRRAGVLSGGEQQMLAIARAMAMSPRLLMIDEMSLGLAPLIVSNLVSRLAEIKAAGLTLLVVEQFAPLILSLCDSVYLLERGEVVEQRRGGEMATTEVLESMHLGVGQRVTNPNEVWIEAGDPGDGQDAITVRLPAWVLRVLEEQNGGAAPERAAERLLLAAAKDMRDAALSAVKPARNGDLAQTLGRGTMQ